MLILYDCRANKAQLFQLNLCLSLVSTSNLTQVCVL